MPISLNLDLALRTQLIQTTQALYNKDEIAAQRAVQQLSTFSPQTVTLIYKKLGEIVGTPTLSSEIIQTHLGRVTFWNQEGRTAPIPQKIKAVETILNDLVMTAWESRRETPNSQEGELVKDNTFYDCGFHPQYSEDGNVYLKTTLSTNLITKIREIISTLLFKCKAYFSFNSKERNLRQLLLSCVELEKQCLQDAYTHVVYSDDSPYHAEHDFFERVSNLYKAIFPNQNHPLRLFPSELLHSIHTINKPQSNYMWCAEQARPFWSNGDLNRCSHFGLDRMNDELYDDRRITRFENNYVPHYLFIHATAESSAELKQACRALRTVLSKITATSLEEIIPVLQRLKQSWDRHTESHELLAEVQSVFSKKDHYKKEHRAWAKHWNSWMRRIPLFRSLSPYKSQAHKAHQLGFRSLREAYAGSSRNTLTGQLNAALAH